MMHDIESIRKKITYDPDTGKLLRKSGKEAGNLRPDGYVRVMIMGQMFYAHVLAYLLMTGNLPADQIDHINRVRNDNRWENLRAVSRLENGMNASLSSRNKSGYTGVFYSKRDDMYTAQIQTNKKSIHLGSFKNKEDAIAARAAAKVKYHNITSTRNV